MIISAFILYFFVILAIGLMAYKKSKNAEDFIIGGRSLNFYVTALSAHASDMSNWLFMGYPALVLLTGGTAVWSGIGLIVGMWFNWQYIAPKLRIETERFGSLTLSAYFGSRFHDRSGILRIIGALLSLLFFAVYISAGLYGMGLLFEDVLGADRILGMTISVVFVVLYTMVGGFRSICWIDLFQALFLLAMIILVPIVALGKVQSLPSVSFWPEQGFLNILLLSLGWGLGYFGQPHILNKFMGIEDVSEMKKSQYVGLTWQTLCIAAATFVGIVGVSYFAGGLANSELIFIEMVKTLFHPFIGGLIICAIFAAAISTMDSQVLVLTSVLSEDVYHRFFRKEASARETVWVSRTCVVLVGALSYCIALFSGGTVLSLVLYAWAGLGSTFGPVLVMGLYTKETNRYGAIAGMICGGLIAGLWPLLGTNVPALVPGFFGNLIVIYGISRLTGGEQESTEKYN